MMLFFVFIASCSQKTNYETDGPFIIATYSPAGPDDFRNMFSHIVSIRDNGTLQLYTEPTKTLKIGNDAPVHESQLKKEEIEKIKELIEKNKFWKFKEDLSIDSQDGVFLYITVNLIDQSQKVGGLNPNDPKFIEIFDYVFDLIDDEDYGVWNEEIADYIIKMNP